MKSRNLVLISAVILLIGVSGAEAFDLGGEGTGQPDSLSRRLLFVGSLVYPRPSRVMRLNPKVPRFAEESMLARGPREAQIHRWLEAGRKRAFETEQKSLQDFSKIDIPIKFPKRIGRVIGQGANLNVSGSEQITFGGQTRYRVNEPVTEYGRRSKFPQLDMRQHLRIDLKGTVGEKIHVMVHHDSDIETPLENRIKLRYEGDDDEIVQSIEMGNTNISIPGSEFVSYSGQHQGLFGAKLLGKLGALNLTAIASKQEGRTAAASFEGAATRDSIVLKDLDYVRNKYFFMKHPYELEQAKEFTDVVVYLDDGIGTNNIGGEYAFAFLYPTSLPDTALWDELGYYGYFNVLERNRDYAIDLITGEISLLTPLQEAHALAVAYVYGNTSGTTRVGGVYENGHLILKMVCPPKTYVIERGDVWNEALQYERKNVYSVGMKYISEEKVEVRIYREDPGTGGTDIQKKYEYAKILGIDLEDEDGIRGTEENGYRTDGYADGGRVNGELGLLLFPDLRPFDPDVEFLGDRPEILEDTNSKIYDAHYSLLKREEDSKYFMVVRFSTPQTTFKLPHINILENSEVVTLDGNRLTRNVDYDIYYDVGQIRFKTDEATRPDAKISVDYEYVPFFSAAQQSLVGMQGIYRFSGRSHIGTAWLYQSKKSPEERPRLGQEPSQIVMGDINGRFEFGPSLMTYLMDALPFVTADKPSKLSIAAEVATSLPNPNTKGSVYIDDMEGVRDLRSFSVMREAWVPASPPTELSWRDTRQVRWYVKDREVREEDLFPEAESRPGEAFIPVMEMDFGGPIYEGASPDPGQQWAGLMRLVSKSGSDFSELRFVEVWLRQKQGGGGRMNIDLGAVSENFFHPWAADSLHTEDKDNDGKLSEDENTGLDGIPSGQPGDTEEDDWYYTEGDYRGINGTEDNPRITPDTEDIDDDGNLDTDEAHFRLSFDLADTVYIVNQSGDWYHYRVPLVDATTLGGSPNWRSIRYLRFFLTEMDPASVFQIAYLQISGASWLEEGIRDAETMELLEPEGDEAFEISAKNSRDDPDYVPPYDPGKDPQGYSKREQSLVFSIKNLENGHAGLVYKTIPGNASNYTLYHTLSFYVHGNADVASDQVYMFVRIGSDSVNFYEYGVRVAPGWKSVEIPFEEVTNLKTQPGDSTTIYGRRVLVRRADREDGWIAVYGGPSITRVSRVGAGVLNHKDASGPITAEVWFDDLRLTDVRKETGVAKRITIGASFSDVLTVNANLRQTDTEFQTLSSKRKGSDDTDYSISASTSIDRFLPSLGFSLPFSVRYHKSLSVPTLKSKSDIALMPEQRALEERSSVDDSYKISFSKKVKATNPLMRLTLDAISASAAYTRKRGVSPEMADTSRGYGGNLSYNFAPWWNHRIRVYREYGISYLPEKVDMSVSGSTRYVKQIDKRQDVVKQDRYTRAIKGNFGISFKPISGPSLETDYSLRMTRDLDQNKNVPILSSIGLGRELTRTQSAGIRIRPTLGRWMRPTLSYDVNYDENADPSVRTASDPAGVRRASVLSNSSMDIVVTLSSLFSSSEKGSETTGVSVYRYVLSRIPDMNFSYLIVRNSKYKKLLGRPGLRFQLGIDPVAPENLVLLSSTGAARPTDEYTRTNSMNFSTEFRPIETLLLNTKYRYNKKVRTYANSTTFDRTSTWPDITGNVSSGFYLGLFRGSVKSSAISFGYKGTSSSRGEGTSKETNRTRKSEWLPLVGWDATWANGVRTTFNIRHSRSQNDNLTGTGSTQESRTSSISFSLRHSFSAPQGMYIPLAGRTLKFKSNLTLSFDVNYESRLQTTPTADNRVDADSRKFGITPKASYSFSKSITGSANARFEQTTDRKLGQTWRTIGISVSVLIRF
jgi:hypothetical protein